MREVLVVGAGKIGTTVAGLLASAGGYQVTLADRSWDVLGRVAPAEAVRTVQLDVEHGAGLLQLLNAYFAVVNATPFHLTLPIAEAASGVGDDQMWSVPPAFQLADATSARNTPVESS